MADEKLDTQVRREQIAEAAMNLIATHGVRRLSIAAIARRVGLVPSGIYRHFKNKGEVLDAVLDLLEKRLAAIVQAAKAEDAGPLPPRDLGGPDVAGARPVGSVVVRDLGGCHRRHARCSPAGRRRISAGHGGSHSSNRPRAHRPRPAPRSAA